MPTDLKTTNDHAANLLTSSGNTFGAETLREYERKHGVTFTTLDTEALTEVRSLVANWQDGGSVEDRARNANHVVYALIDLLGLGE